MIIYITSYMENILIDREKIIKRILLACSLGIICSIYISNVIP